MKQILAIFAKDARRFWPEILVSLAVLLAMVVVYPKTWQATNHLAIGGYSRFTTSGNFLGFFAGCVVALVPISWWILIARLIHGERLVGDNQFWLTRPYEWPKFLAAKLLFLAVFLYAPLFLAQCALLAKAGFHPSAYLPGLFYNLLMATGILVLPLAALSAVTTNFGRMTLVVLGILLFRAAAAFGYSQLPSDLTQGISGLLRDRLSFLFIAAGCAAVVVLQYALRKTRLAWFTIGTTTALLTALTFLNPDQFLMNRYYPAPSAGTANIVQFSYAAKDLSQPRANEAEDKRDVDIVVPMRASGVPDDTTVIPLGLKATIEAPGGARWESHWQVIYNEHYLAGEADSPMHFVIRRAVYDQFRSAPVTLYLTIALDEARVATTRVIPLPENDFSVPEFGICRPERTWFTKPLDITGITCRSAMRQPQLTYITAQWTEECSAMQSAPETVIGTDWTGSFSTDPADFGITSVWETPLNFSNLWPVSHQGESPRPHQLCPGSPITFTRYERVGRRQIVVTIPNFQVPEIANDELHILRNFKKD